MTDNEIEINKWRKEARSNKRQSNKLQKIIDEQEVFITYLTKKILRLTEEDEMNMHVTNELNKFKSMNVTEKIEDMQHGQSVGENK
ncbi:Coiled-coil domain-containing protein 18 [uncultured Mediterranean phage uvMED]|jgi:hypothetical protein|nr:Coiled-coil domain-containing protein 18 [uncultured Mediterranean phage uvMED]BAQ86789.1 hypothetical protein [uncultured Mediterranean phage uvMED]